MTISTLICITVAIASSVDAVCRPNSPEMYYESVGFLNCIGEDIMLDFLRNFDRTGRVLPRKFVNHELSKLSNLFERTKCINPTSYINNFEGGLQRFGTPANVISLVNDLRELIWTVTSTPIVSECILERVRARFLKYMRDCTRLNLPTSKGVKYEDLIRSQDFIPDEFNAKAAEAGTLKAFPVAFENTDLVALQRYIELMILTFMSIEQCGVDHREDAQQLRSKLMADQFKAMCNCVKTTFSCECKKVFIDSCGTTQNCLTEFTEDAAEVFQRSKIITRSKYCVENFETDNAKIAKLLVAGLSLKDKVFSLEGGDEMESFRNLVRGTFEAMFRSDICGDCGRYVESCL